MSENGKIFITGGSGFIGSRLIKALVQDGQEIIALTRMPRQDQKSVHWVQGISTDNGDWKKEISGCKAVINLAGEPLAGVQWTASKKLDIKESRIKTTKKIVEAISQSIDRPSTLISASAIGYYTKNEETIFDESGPNADDFLGEVCKEWEAAAQSVKDCGVRLVNLRIGVVLGVEGGALSKMLPPFKLGMGGTIGTGKQWVSWIHVDDLVGIIQFALKNPEVQGIVNCVAPNPITMKEFCSKLGEVLHRPTLFPVPGFVLRTILGESSQIILDGQKIIPAAIEKAGYNFQFPYIEKALDNLLGK